MKKMFCFSLVVTFVLFAGAAVAQETPVTTEKVVVTATRTPASLDKIGGNSVTVITAADIKAKGQMMVSDVLKGIPGLDIVSNGGPGTTTVAFIRGADSKNTLVLVDGVMYNDPSSSTRSANLGDINVDNIERIEVVRGAMSVLYGSNATAGVINIITKKGAAKPSVYGSIEGGSYNTWKGSVGASGASDKFNFATSLSGAKSDGFSVADDDNPGILHNGNTSEDDAWENFTFSAKMGVDINPDFDINGVVRYSKSETDLDDYYFDGGFAIDQADLDMATFSSTPNPLGLKKQSVENDQTVYKLDIHNFFADQALESSLYVQGSVQNREGYNAVGDSDYDYDGETREIGWQGSYNFKDINTFYLGSSYFQEFIGSKSSALDTDAYIYSLWAQDQLFLGENLDVICGLRYDNHEKFGDSVTFRIAPSYKVTPTMTILKASYGTGFRAPSLFELYSDYGNEELQEETSQGWDAGFEQPLMENRLKFGASYFDMKYEDRIDYDFAISKYNQLEGDTKTKGFEAFIQWMPVSELDFTLNYTYTDTEDHEGKPLVRRPENKLFFNTRFRFVEKAVINLDVIWADERNTVSQATDADGNRVGTLDAYTSVNLSASYDITEWLQIYGRANNLFDEFYEEAWSYATPGLSGYLGLRVKY